jgi:hypothetical protein
MPRLWYRDKVGHRRVAEAAGSGFRRDSPLGGDFRRKSLAKGRSRTYSSGMGVYNPWANRSAFDIARFHLASQDIVVLEKAARRLRSQGWWLLFWSGLSFLLLFLMLGIGAFQALPVFFIFGLALLVFAFIYFWLAKFVGRGRRWAIGIALFLVAVVVTLLVARVLLARRATLGLVIFDTLILIAELNLLKLLILAWAAARRIQLLARPPEDLEIQYD